MNKRGISPLIATVLIIGFTIVLAVLVIAWLSGVFQTKFGVEDCNVKGQELCAQNLISISSSDDGFDTSVKIAWLGDIDDTPDSVKVAFLDEDGVTLDVQDAQFSSNGLINITYPELSDIAEIRAVYNPSDDIAGVTCSDILCPSISENVIRVTTTGLVGTEGAIFVHRNTDKDIMIKTLTNGKIKFRIYNHELYSNTKLSSGEWYHVAGTYNGTKMKLYINGQYDNSSSFSLDVNWSGGFGDRFGGYDNWTGFFNGVIDEVAIFNSSLDETNIQNLMDSEISSNENGLAGLWHLNGDFFDSSTNNNSGSCNTGTCPLSTPNAKFGEAYRFDGVDDFIYFDNIFQGVQNTFTIMAWIKAK